MGTLQFQRRGASQLETRRRQFTLRCPEMHRLVAQCPSTAPVSPARRTAAPTALRPARGRAPELLTAKAAGTPGLATALRARPTAVRSGQRHLDPAVLVARTVIISQAQAAPAAARYTCSLVAHFPWRRPAFFLPAAPLAHAARVARITADTSMAALVAADQSSCVRAT